MIAVDRAVRSTAGVSFFFCKLQFRCFLASITTMSFDPRRERSSSKRKGRDGPEEAVSRKKHQRKAADSDDEDMQYEEFGSGGEDAPSKSSRKSTGKSALREEKDYPSVNDLKRRIRDVKRLLNKSDLPADARIVQERALAGYEEDLAQETARRERSTMIKKYHFVRFLGMLSISFGRFGVRR
jgi:hypothetical protein